MIAPAIPANEKERLASLRLLGLLDTPPEERFDAPSISDVIAKVRSYQAGPDFDDDVSVLKIERQADFPPERAAMASR